MSKNRNQKWNGGADTPELSPAPVSSTNISMYILLLFLFIIMMYCSFNQDVRNGNTKYNLESLGNILLILFGFVLSAFILWKLYKAYSTNDSSITTKGFNMAEFATNITGDENIFGKFTNSIIGFIGLIGLIYLIEFIVYMVQNKSRGVGLKMVIFFGLLFFSTIAGVFFKRITVPLSIVLGIGILLNIISSILVIISLYAAPTREVTVQGTTQKRVQFTEKSAELLNIYKILTITCLCILFALMIFLFTPTFQYSFNGNIPMDVYIFNNAFTMLLSLMLVLISSYNIYISNDLMFYITDRKRWT